eukprot:gene15083-16639_t
MEKSTTGGTLGLVSSFDAAANALGSSDSQKHWDPTESNEWDKEKPTTFCIQRIKKDITEIYNCPPPFICIVPDQENITKVHALVIGPGETPYEGGFFYFFIRCPPDYPIRPPRVRLVTTGSGTVRFNPNLYRNGKVCLSILGTWHGPPWSASQSLSSVLISIQSLMSEKPYHNEPGFEQERRPGDSKKYNECILHETLRVAVCMMLDGVQNCPEALLDVMEKSFLEFYSYYEMKARECIHLDGSSFQDPFGENMGVFNFKDIISNLRRIQERLIKKQENNS